MKVSTNSEKIVQTERKSSHVGDLHSLAGTKWECYHDPNNKDKRFLTSLDFVSSHACNITIKYQDSSIESQLVNYDLSKDENKGYFKYSNGFYGEGFKYTNNILTIELLYKYHNRYKRETYVFNRVK